MAWPIGRGPVTFGVLAAYVARCTGREAGVSWRIVVKAALAAVFVSVAAGLFANALLMAGLPLPAVRVLIVGLGVAAAAVVGGTTARQALRRDLDRIRARAYGALAAGAAGLFIGLLGTLDATIALGLALAAAFVGWLGARFATVPSWIPRDTQDP